MSTQRRKRPVSSRQDSRSEDRSASRQRDRSSSLTTNDSIERLTAVMTTFIESTAERRQSSVPMMRGDVVPVFNPDDREQTAVAWCKKVDELREIFKWSEEATIYFATAKLQGLAEVWYRGLPSLKFTWEEWKQKIKESFPTQNNYYADLQTMINRRKRHEETYAKYFYEKMALLNNCKIFGSDAVSCIIGGLSDNVVKTGATAGNHQSPESLYQYLSNVGSLSSYTSVDSKPHHSKFASGNKMRRVESNKTTYPRASQVTCFKCQKVGHTAKVCGERNGPKATDVHQVKRCTFCRREGHIEKDCFRKKNAIKPTI